MGEGEEEESLCVHRAGEPWDMVVQRVKEHLPWREPTFEEQNAEADFLVGREVFVQGVGQGIVTGFVRNRLGASGHVIDFVARGEMEVILSRKGNAATAWLILPAGARERMRASRKGKFDTYDRMLAEHKLARETEEGDSLRLQREQAAQYEQQKEIEARERRNKLREMWERKKGRALLGTSPAAGMQSTSILRAPAPVPERKAEGDAMVQVPVSSSTAAVWPQHGRLSEQNFRPHSVQQNIATPVPPSQRHPSMVRMTTNDWQDTTRPVPQWSAQSPAVHEDQQQQKQNISSLPRREKDYKLTSRHYGEGVDRQPAGQLSRAQHHADAQQSPSVSSSSGRADRPSTTPEMRAQRETPWEHSPIGVEKRGEFAVTHSKQKIGGLSAEPRGVDGVDPTDAADSRAKAQHNVDSLPELQKALLLRSRIQARLKGDLHSASRPELELQLDRLERLMAIAERTSRRSALYSVANQRQQEVQDYQNLFHTLQRRLDASAGSHFVGSAERTFTHVLTSVLELD